MTYTTNADEMEMSTVFLRPGPGKSEPLRLAPTVENGRRGARKSSKTLVFKYFPTEHVTEPVVVVCGDHRDTYRLPEVHEYKGRRWIFRARLVTEEDNRSALFMSARLDEDGNAWL